MLRTSAVAESCAPRGGARGLADTSGGGSFQPREASNLQVVHHLVHDASVLQLWTLLGQMSRLTLAASTDEQNAMVRWTFLLSSLSLTHTHKQLQAGWTALPYSYCPPGTLLPEPAPPAFSPCTGGDSEDSDGSDDDGAPATSPAAVAIVIPLQKVPYTTRAALVDVVENGDGQMAPLYLWTKTLRAAAWSECKDRGRLQDGFGELMKVTILSCDATSLY